MLLLWMLAVTSLAVYNAAAPPPPGPAIDPARTALDPDQYLIDEPPPAPPAPPGTTRTIQCYRCDGEGDCNRNNLFLCEAKHYICGTLARSPNFAPVLGCVTAKPKLCSLTYARANNELEFSCFCAGQTCNSIFDEEIQKDLLKFYADFSKYVNLINGTDYTSLFYEMVGKRAPSAYSEVTLKWPLEADTEKVLHPTGGVHVPHVIYTNVAHAEALRHDTTAASSDDEDDDEGSGAGIVSGAGSGVLVVVPKSAGAAAAAATTTAEPGSPLPPVDRDDASPTAVPATAPYLTLALVIILI